MQYAPTRHHKKQEPTESHCENPPKECQGRVEIVTQADGHDGQYIQGPGNWVRHAEFWEVRQDDIF